MSDWYVIPQVLPFANSKPLLDPFSILTGVGSDDIENDDGDDDNEDEDDVGCVNSNQSSNIPNGEADFVEFKDDQGSSDNDITETQD